MYLSCNDCVFFSVPSTLFYAKFPIIAHHMADSSSAIRGYIDFYYPWPSSLYSFDDEERTSLFRSGGAQTLREIVTSASFSGRDRSVVPKSHFLFGDAIDAKDSLSLPSCCWIYHLEEAYFSLLHIEKHYRLSYLCPCTEERMMIWRLTPT